MADKDFGRKPKFGPVSKKGPPKPLPKNFKNVGRLSLRESRPTSIFGRDNPPWLPEVRPAPAETTLDSGFRRNDAYTSRLRI